jgi:hypothetical protein
MSGQNLAAFKAAGLPAHDMSRFKTAIKTAAQAAKVAASGALLLRLGKDGIWVYGPDNVEVQDGSEWVINPFSIAMGYAAWGAEKTKLEGTLVAERMALIAGENPIDPNSLRDIDDAPWAPQVQFDALCLTGDDAGTLVRYKTTSTGGRRAAAGLMQELSAQSDADEPFVPVVTLGSDSYQHKKYGKTYVPVFEIVEWKHPEENSTSEGAADGEPAETEQDDPPAEATPQRRRPAAAAAEPEAEEPEAETVRTRRPAAANGAAKAAAKDAEEAPPARRGAAATRRPAVGAKAEPEKAEPRQVDRGAVVRRRRR